MAVQTLFDHATVVPTSFGTDNDYLTLGTRFYFAVDGTISAIAFYKSAAHNSTTLIVRFYSQTGTVLGEGTLTDVPLGAGWVTVPLATPVAVDAMTAYLAAVWYPNGAYPYQSDAFNGVEIVRGDIHGIDAVDATWGDIDNGRFHYGLSEITFPTGASRANFFIDVLFEAEGEEVPPITASGLIAEAGDQLTATAALAIKAAGAIVEADDVLTSTAKAPIGATATISEAGDTLQASARVGLAAALQTVEEGDTLAASATLRIDATMAALEPGDTLAATMTTTAAPAHGTATIQEAGDTLTATARLRIRLTASIIEQGDIAAGATTMPDDIAFHQAIAHLRGPATIAGQLHEPVASPAQERPPYEYSGSPLRR